MGFFKNFLTRHTLASESSDPLRQGFETGPWVVCQDQNVAVAVKEAFPDFYVAALCPGENFTACAEEAVMVEPDA